MAGQFTERDFLDFSGGINKYDSDLLLNDNEVQDGRNVYSDGRALQKRRGFRQLCAGGSADVKTVYPYNNSYGASYLLKVNASGEFYTIMAPPKGTFDIDTDSLGSDFHDPHVTGNIYHYFIRYVDFDGRRSLPSEITTFEVTD